MVINMFLVALVAVLVVPSVGCQGERFLSTPRGVPVRAVYYYQGHAELSLQDVKAHPEIVVVQTFDKFKQSANQKVALWIDRSAVPFTDQQQQWINDAPQAYYPIVLVGSSDTLHSFRDFLGMCCFSGPAIEPTPMGPELGFSVIQEAASSDPTFPEVTFANGYDQVPTVQAILEVTNALLDGKLKPIPSPSFIIAATPSAPPNP